MLHLLLISDSSIHESCLRHSVLDNERRPGSCVEVITAKESHVVCAVIVIVIFLEAQAKLCNARQVDEGITRLSDGDVVPVVYGLDAK